MNLNRFLLTAAAILMAATAMPCTSLIASGSATASGRPLLWKHRDTSADNNFIHRIEEDGKIGYVGLFNGGDSINLAEAWMGMNDAGFAIMNTVAYNLPANAPSWIDREGYVMAEALQTCRSVDDLARLLDSLPKPMGVRTNFGVIDADGNGAYFETDDYKYVRYDLRDAQGGVMIRTNYAYSGTPDEGKGYIRHQNVVDLLKAQIDTGSLTPASLTEGVSRSFYNSLTGYDGNESSDTWTIDQDFVPRHSSTASIAVEGILSGDTPDSQVMWANIAYPPCGYVVAVTNDSVPAAADMAVKDGKTIAPLAAEAAELKALVFPIERGNGAKYINLDILRPISEENYQKSLESYSNFRSGKSGR